MLWFFRLFFFGLIFNFFRLLFVWFFFRLIRCTLWFRISFGFFVLLPKFIV